MQAAPDPAKLPRHQSWPRLVRVPHRLSGPLGPWGVKRRETCIDTRCATLVSKYNADTATAGSSLLGDAAARLPAPQCRRREAAGFKPSSPSDTLATLGETISGAKWKKSRATTPFVADALALSKPYGKYSGALVAQDPRRGPRRALVVRHGRVERQLPG